MRVTEFPSNTTLEFTATANLILFYVTHTSIIDPDFSN